MVLDSRSFRRTFAGIARGMLCLGVSQFGAKRYLSDGVAKLLNRAFRGASSADFIWESKLPSNYHALIEKVFDGFLNGLCRTDVYAMLCRVNSIDGGSKPVSWLSMLLLLLTGAGIVYNYD